MKKVISLLMATVLCAALFCACTPTVEPKDVWHNSDETVSGGQPLAQANLNGIIYSNQTEDNTTLLTLSFSLGSSMDGNYTLLGGLPEYTVSFCQSPARLVLSIKDLEFWDYQQRPGTDQTGRVLGNYRIVPSDGRTYTQIYFNLRNDMLYKVEEDADCLLITLKDAETVEKTRYYVVGNLYYEYQSGILADDAELTPTLTSDNSGIVMISCGFDTKEEAEALKASMETEYALALSEKALRVVALTGSELPAYTDSAEISELNEKILLKRNGINESANVFFADADLLCSSNDGRMLFAMTENADEYDSVRLYTVDAAGNRTSLFDYECISVAYAMFSPDGSKLFFAECIDGCMLCSIYDFATHRLTAIDDEQLGTYITGAAFGADSSKLYIMAGDELPVLTEYDIASATVTGTHDIGGVETELYCIDNILYYIDVIDDTEMLVAYNTDAKTSTQVCRAQNITAYGKALLVKNETAGDDGLLSSVMLYADGALTTVVADAPVMEYFVSQDGAYVYYSLLDDDDSDDGFIKTVRAYNVATASATTLFRCKNCSLNATPFAGRLALTSYYEKGGYSYPATYLINVD